MAQGTVQTEVLPRVWDEVGMMKAFSCILNFIMAAAIIYCAYIGEIQCVAFLASSLALYASKAILRGE